MNDAQKLKEIAKGFTVLCAEDNDALRLNVLKLLKKFFDTVLVAPDGKEALEIFKKNRVDLVISDINMPHINGWDLTQRIQEIDPRVRVIIMSAFDDKEHLMSAIQNGVFSYFKKPINVTQLIQTLLKAVLEIKKEKQNQTFLMHLKSIFNYQSSMVLMLDKKKPILANRFLLEFFDVENIDEFKKTYANLGDSFMAHDGFLYNHGGVDWFDVIELNEGKLFHIKIKDKMNEIKHFTLRYKNIPDEKNYAIILFDDITELDLLNFNDEVQEEAQPKEIKTLFNLLEVIKKNKIIIEVHNYYKGLSITNNATITSIGDSSIKLKSTFTQLKSMQFEHKTILVCEALPYPLECVQVSKMSFENLEVELKGLQFVKNSAIQRKTIRVVPDEKQRVELLIGERKFQNEIEVEDISLDAVKLRLDYCPAGLDEEIFLDIVLNLQKESFTFNTKAKLLKKSESKHSFTLVFVFIDAKKSELVKYITKRQMAIIREFKGMQNG